MEEIYFFQDKGLSMWPSLKGEEKLIVKKVPLSNLKIGDLLVYRSKEKIICHRLIKKVKDKNRYIIYARADASLGLPELVKEEMLLGKVIGILKNNKIIYVDKPIQRLINRIILLLSPLINFMGKVYTLFCIKR